MATAVEDAVSLSKPFGKLVDVIDVPFDKPFQVCFVESQWQRRVLNAVDLRKEVQGPYEKAAALADEVLFAIRTVVPWLSTF